MADRYDDPPLAVSVVIAAYEQTTTLEWLLASLAEQEYDGACELLICDDGSSPRVLDAVQAAQHTHEIDVRYIWQPDAGFRASRSRNNGIRAAQGDLLVFLDAEQVVDPDFIARHVAAHRQPRRLVAGAMKRVPLDPAIGHHADARRMARARPIGFPERQADWARSTYPWMCCLSGNMSCRRQPDVRFDEHFVGWGGEDRELAYRLTTRCGYEMWYDAATVSYHFGEGGVVTLTDHERIVEFLRNHVYFRGLYPADDLSPALGLLRSCHLDEASDRWYRAHADARPLAQIVRQAQDWMTRHDGGRNGYGAAVGAHAG